MKCQNTQTDTKKLKKKKIASKRFPLATQHQVAEREYRILAVLDKNLSYCY